MSDVEMTFAAWLRSARRNAGLSQQKVADVLKAQGMAVFMQSTVAKIERGDRPVRLDEAAALVSLFETTLDAALGMAAGSAPSFASRELARRTSLLQQISHLVDTELTGGVA